MTASVDQLKKQLLQLAELAKSGALSPENHQAAKDKLEKELIEAVLNAPNATTASQPAANDEPSAGVGAARLPRKLLWGMVAFVAVVGAGGYAWLGNPGAWQVGPHAQSNVAAADGAQAGAGAGDSNAAHTMETQQITAMVETLAGKLKANPNNAEGWAILGRSYGVLGRWSDAIAAYKRAIELRPDDAQTYADYADALGVTQGRKLDGEPAKLVAKALALDPNNFKALFLSGTIAYEKPDFKEAANLWERALQRAPNDNPEFARQIKGALDDARQRAGLPPLPDLPVAAASVQPAAPASNGKVSGRVTLAKALVGKASPEDTVFIFARAAQGSKMPLAILRKQVKDLPFDFELTDEMAMAPQMKLSGFADVVVGARVSKSGQAMPQSGDLQGLSAPTKVGVQGLKIEIGEALP